MTDADAQDELARLFDRAVALDADARARFLADDVADDALREKLRRLLAHDDAGDDPIDAAIGQAAIMATRPELPASIGAYRPVGRLGTGGMGVVYLAERADGRYEGHVAIKVLNGLFGEDAIARFRRERTLLARLDHPNIARVIDAGELSGGTPYVVMEYIDGRPIDAWCRERRLPLESRIALLAQAADAVQHAHRRLVVHRDLKPENMLVRDDGIVKLLDFGIARMLSEEPSRDVNATIAYTPGYASPEQRSGAPLTVASDIYSLGVLLAELLVGQPLPRGADGHPTQFRPSELARGTIERARLTGDLDTIVLKATHADPERRYASAEALADDLRRHLRRRPIRARPDSTTYRIGKLLQRHPLAAMMTVVVTAALVTAAVALKVQRDAALAAEQRAARSAKSAQATAQFLSRLFIDADPTVGGAKMSAIDLIYRGAERVEQAVPDDPAVRSELKNTLAQALMNLGDMQRGLALAEAAVAESPRHDDVSRAIAAERMRLLAQLQWRTGDPAAAVKTVEQALALLPVRSAYPEAVVRLNNTRVVALGRLPKQDVALNVRMAEAAAQEAAVLLPRGHYLRAAANANLAGTYDDAGRYRELIDLRRRALAEFDADPATMPGDRWLAQIALARAYRVNGDAAAALRELTEPVERLAQHYPGAHPNAAYALGELAATENALGEHDKALQAATASLAIWAQVEYQGDAGIARLEAAKALVALGRVDEARPYREQALVDEHARVRREAQALAIAPP